MKIFLVVSISLAVFCIFGQFDETLACSDNCGSEGTGGLPAGGGLGGLGGLLGSLPLNGLTGLLPLGGLLGAAGGGSSQKAGGDTTVKGIANTVTSLIDVDLNVEAPVANNLL